jgi:hypothetical protein
VRVNGQQTTLREVLAYIWCCLKGHDWMHASYYTMICRKRCGAVRHL